MEDTVPTIDSITTACEIISMLVLPAAYLSLCAWMAFARVPRAPYLPFFFIFGSYGGWFMGWSLIPCEGEEMFLILLILFIAAPLSLLGSALWLWFRDRPFTGFHRTAFYGCLSYIGLIAVLVCLWAQAAKKS